MRRINSAAPDPLPTITRGERWLAKYPSNFRCNSAGTRSTGATYTVPIAAMLARPALPNSWPSSTCAGTAEASSRTNAKSLAGLAWWTVRARVSLPDPGAPASHTGARLVAANRACASSR